jgi:ribonuclease D
MFDDAPLMVEDDEALVALAERLRSATVIGVDTESDSMYHYKEKVCLVQITDAHGDIIVDPLTIDDMSPLEPIFADPSVVKIFHGADYDIVSLKRDFGYQTNNLFDTLVAAQFLGLQGLGLADLIGRFFGIPIDKKFQRHDWSRRPLHPEHLDYARGDTHWLLALREILLRRLERVAC